MAASSSQWKQSSLCVNLRCCGTEVVHQCCRELPGITTQGSSEAGHSGGGSEAGRTAATWDILWADNPKDVSTAAGSLTAHNTVNHLLGTVFLWWYLVTYFMILQL